MSISESEQFNLLDQLAEEFAERFRRGERPALSEYTRRYPELADEIRELFPAMVKVEQAESADSRLLATVALLKNAVQVWDLATGRAVSEPLPHPGDYWGLFAVRFSPDGNHLLSGHKDGQLRYWDWRAAKLACPAMAHEFEVMDVAITPDGRFALVAVSGRAAVQVWELTTGRRVAPRVQLGSAEGTWCQTVAVTPDGRRALGSFPDPSASQGMSMAVVDLEALVSHSSTPIADLALLAELATARRIELGDLSGLTTDQWQERWRLFQESQ